LGSLWAIPGSDRGLCRVQIDQVLRNEALLPVVHWVTSLPETKSLSDAAEDGLCAAVVLTAVAGSEATAGAALGAEPARGLANDRSISSSRVSPSG
jgi:hypothetical protein